MSGPAVPEPSEPPSPAHRLRDFVPVELVRRGADANRRAAPASRVPESAATEPTGNPARAWPDRVTLFADGEV